jgi:hypothetical protein
LALTQNFNIINYKLGALVNEAFVDFMGMGTLERASCIEPIGVPETPKCWKTIYSLLDLYATMPETKTVEQRPISPDVNEKLSSKKDMKGLKDEDEGGDSGTPLPSVSVVAQERTRVMVFGVAKIHRTKLLATLSGLKVNF